jgi:hypothetical protein
MGLPLPYLPLTEIGGSYNYNQGQSLPYPSQYSDITLDPTGQNIQSLPVTDSRVINACRYNKVSDNLGNQPASYFAGILHYTVIQVSSQDNSSKMAAILVIIS